MPAHAARARRKHAKRHRPARLAAMVLEAYHLVMPVGKTALQCLRYRPYVSLIQDAANLQPVFLVHRFDGAEIAEPRVTGRLQQFRGPAAMLEQFRMKLKIPAVLFEHPHPRPAHPKMLRDARHDPFPRGRGKLTMTR